MLLLKPSEIAQLRLLINQEKANYKNALNDSFKKLQVFRKSINELETELEAYLIRDHSLPGKNLS